MASTQLRLPTFGNSRCVIFTACGQLKGIDAETRKWLGHLDDMTIRYRAKGCAAYLRALYGGHDGTHLHFDVALSRHFQSRKPEVTHKKVDVAQVIARLRGMPISVRIKATFAIKKDEVQNPLFEILNPIKIPVDQSDSITVKFTGVELQRSGGDFLDKITLSIDDDQYWLTCDYQQNSKITSAYLVEIANRSDSVFDSIVQVGVRNGENNEH